MKAEFLERFARELLDGKQFLTAVQIANLVPDDLQQVDVNPEFAAGWEACQGAVMEAAMGVARVKARECRHGRLEVLGKEEYYGEEMRCSKCGTEFMLADGREIIACPHCAADLRPDEERDRKELAEAVLALNTEGSCQECFGCWKRKDGDDDTCVKCKREKTIQAARLLLELLG